MENKNKKLAITPRFVISKSYKLNCDKIKTLDDVIALFNCMDFRYTCFDGESLGKFEPVKHLFDEE